MKASSKREPSKAKQLTRKDYDKLRRTAYEYVVIRGLDQKDVAKIIGVSETTLSKWSTKYKWRDDREARQQCSSTDADNTKKLLSLLARQRLELEDAISDAVKIGDTEEEKRLRKQASALSDEMSKVNKALLSLNSKSYSLGVFIDVMEEIFNSLRAFNEDLWEQTIPFQENLIRKKTIELG